MSNIFTLENIDDFSEKLNIDELYERKRQQDVQQLELYNKILNRIHVRIKTTSRQRTGDQFCWFVVPEVIIGVPRYDNAGCIAYILDKLKNNGFNVKYIHPNTFFISWAHWVPSYVRTELKRKTGIVVDEYGNKVTDETNERETNDEPEDINKGMFNVKDQGQQQNTTQTKQQKKYTPINSYKPSGNLVYNQDLLNKIEDKFI